MSETQCRLPRLAITFIYLLFGLNYFQNSIPVLGGAYDYLGGGECKQIGKVETIGFETKLEVEKIVR